MFKLYTEIQSKLERLKMINSIFEISPNKCYTNSIESIINDTLRFVDAYNYKDTNSSFYKLREEEGNIIFKCLMSGVDEEDLEITIKNKTLEVKTSENIKAKDFVIPFHKKISLFKDINPDLSFASLEKGILTITMPLKEAKEIKKIKFK